MEGCEGEHVFQEEEDIVGTWMFEKNETYMLVGDLAKYKQYWEWDHVKIEVIKMTPLDSYLPNDRWLSYMIILENFKIRLHGIPRIAESLNLTYCQ